MDIELTVFDSLYDIYKRLGLLVDRIERTPDFTINNLDVSVFTDQIFRSTKLLKSKNHGIESIDTLLDLKD